MTTRRDFLGITGTLAAAVALQGCPRKSSGFFSSDERLALETLANRILPPDAEPGAAALGAFDYIERFLTAFERDAIPHIFSGGPFSGREPLPDGQGGASTQFPPDSFSDFVPLDRISEYVWRLKLYGSAGVPGGKAPNEAIAGPQKGLRAIVKKGLAEALAAAPARIDTLSATQLEAVWSATSSQFRDEFQQLVNEACFADPVYGGNKDSGGWKIAHFEGDVQPLGYSHYDETARVYREDPQRPVSTANPGADPEPLDADTHALLVQIIAFLGGQAFP